MRYGFIAMTAVLAAASASFGAAVPWTPPSGSTSNFSYANGFDYNGPLGNPTVDNTGFAFGPAALISTASNGTNLSSDTAEVDLTAAAGKTFNSISASVAGDYTILGTGSVDAIGALQVRNLDTQALLALPMAFTGTPAATVTSTGGNFSGNVTLPLPAGWTHVRVTVPNTISSTAGVNSTALIQTKDADIVLNTTVPEPATAAIGLGALALLRRRR